jgi:hypothetical protein
MIWNDFGPSMFYLYIWMNGTRTRDILLELMNGVLCGGPGAARARGGSLPEPTDSPAITATTASPLTSPSRVRRPPPPTCRTKELATVYFSSRVSTEVQFCLLEQREGSARTRDLSGPQVPGSSVYDERQVPGDWVSNLTLCTPLRMIVQTRED